MTETNAQRSIGRLEGKLDALMETVKAQGERSDESRARLYDRIDKMANEQSRQDREIQDMRKVVARIEPVANRFAQLEQRGLALVAVAAVVWMFIGNAVTSGVASFGAWVTKALTNG